MNEIKRTYWIDDWYHTEPNKTIINYDWAETCFLKAKEIVLNEQKQLSVHRGGLIRDFIRLGKPELGSELEVGLDESNIYSIDIYKIRGLASKSHKRELLTLLPIRPNYGNAIIANRLISEGLAAELLQALKFEELEFNTKSEIVNILSRKTDDYDLVVQLYKICQKDDAYSVAESTAISRMASRLVQENKIDFQTSIQMLKETKLFNDPSLGIIATGYVQNGNIQLYEKCLDLMESKDRIKWNVLFNAKTKYLNLRPNSQREFVNVLNSVKYSQEAKMFHTLFTEYFEPELKLDQRLFDFYDKHKRKQVDDTIHNYLISKKRFKDDILFVDAVQGHNRFSHYEQSIVKLIELGEHEYCIEKAKGIKSNDVRLAIVDKLCQMDEVELATKAKNELLKSPNYRNLSNGSFIEYYARNSDMENANKLIEKDKSSLSRAMKYQSLGRFYMGIEFRKAE
jgi:hypothetical protein